MKSTSSHRDALGKVQSDYRNDGYSDQIDLHSQNNVPSARFNANFDGLSVHPSQFQRPPPNHAFRPPPGGPEQNLFNRPPPVFSGPTIFNRPPPGFPINEPPPRFPNQRPQHPPLRGYGQRPPPSAFSHQEPPPSRFPQGPPGGYGNQPPLHGGGFRDQGASSRYNNEGPSPGEFNDRGPPPITFDKSGPPPGHFDNAGSLEKFNDAGHPPDDFHQRGPLGNLSNERPPHIYGHNRDPPLGEDYDRVPSHRDFSNEPLPKFIKQSDSDFGGEAPRFNQDHRQFANRGDPSFYDNERPPRFNRGHHFNDMGRESRSFSGPFNPGDRSKRGRSSYNRNQQSDSRNRPNEMMRDQIESNEVQKFTPFPPPPFNP